MLQLAVKDRRRRLFGTREKNQEPQSSLFVYSRSIPREIRGDYQSCDIDSKTVSEYRKYFYAQRKTKKVARPNRFDRLIELASKVATKQQRKPDILKLLKQFRIEHKFEKLAEQWEQETSLLSSPTRKAMHPAYREIVLMGMPAVPLILRRMKRRGGHWFWALTEITKESPIPKSAHGRIADMRDAWIKWGQERGYC